MQGAAYAIVCSPLRRWLGRIVFVGSTLAILMLALCLAVPAVHADSPFNDPAYRRPVGGGTGGTGVRQGTAASAALPAIPDGYQELPPPLLTAARMRANSVTALAPLQ